MKVKDLIYRYGFSQSDVAKFFGIDETSMKLWIIRGYPGKLDGFFDMLGDRFKSFAKKYPDYSEASYKLLLFAEIMGVDLMVILREKKQVTAKDLLEHVIEDGIS